METIQVVLDSQLLQATRRAARRAGLNRSALIREALREYLKNIERRELESRDRRGYTTVPEDAVQASRWEREVAWPPE